MATKVQRGTASNLLEDKRLAVGEQLAIPVKDVFTDDEIGSVALGNTNRLKFKNSAGVVKEVANVEDLGNYQVLSTSYVGIGGETTFTLPALIGRTILVMFRVMKIKVVNTAPTGTDIQFNNSTGVFTVASDYAINAGEDITILSQSANGSTTDISNTIHRQVATYADMQGLLTGDNPTKVIEYTVLADETNGGVIGHYTHYNNNLTYFVEGDVTI